MKKTIGHLIDEIAITNIKIFFLVDKIQAGVNNFEKEDALKLQNLNSYRSELSNAINEYFGDKLEMKVKTDFKKV